MSTILIADDEPAIADAFADVLKDEGHDTLTVGDGSAALSLLLRGGVDLVISDVLMPRLNGFQLLAALRETGNPVPVVLVSAHLPGLEQAIAVPFLRKPVDLDDLIATVNQILVHESA